MSDALAAELDALLGANAPVAPFLRKRTPEQLRALGPAASAHYHALFMRDYESRVDHFLSPDPAPAVEHLNRLALLYACATPLYVAPEELAHLAATLPALLPLPRHPDFASLVLNNAPDYDTLVRFGRLGAINLARHRRHAGFSRALASYPFADRGNGDYYRDRPPHYEQLFAYPETISEHLPALFTRHARVDYSPCDQWDQLLDRLLAEGHVTRARLLDYVLAIPTDGSDLDADAPRYGSIDAAVVKWFLGYLQSLRPTPAELLARQPRLFALVAGRIPGARNVGAAYAKTLSTAPDFDARAYLDAVAGAWANFGLAPAKTALATVGNVLASQPDARDAVAAWTTAAGQHPKEKVRALVAAFAKTHHLAPVTVELPDVPRARAAGERPEAQIDKLNALLASPDAAGVRVGLQLVDAGDFSPELLESLFVIARVTSDDGLRERATALLHRHGSPALQAALALGHDLHREATEATLRDYLRRYARDTELDGLRLARALYRKTDRGIVALLAAVDEDERAALLGRFVRGATFDMRGRGLTSVPKALRRFPDLEVIDLRDNRLRTLPASLKGFRRLRRLLLGGNRLEAVPPALGQLPALEELDLSRNWLPEDDAFWVDVRAALPDSCEVKR